MSKILSLTALAVIVGLLVACAGTGKRKTDSVVKGDYPSPQTSYQGRTADVWYELAQDADGRIFDDSIKALKSLGAEGMPYLIRLCEACRNNLSRLDVCLMVFPHQHVADADLPFFLTFLDERYKGRGGPSDGDVRIYAVGILCRSGPRAASCLPELRKHQGTDSHFQLAAREAVQVIEGMDRQEASRLRQRDGEELNRRKER